MTIAEDILNRAIALGTSKSAEASAAAAAATGAAQGFSYLNAPKVNLPPVVVEPPVNIPMNASGLDTAVYGSTYNQIMTDLSDKFAAYFSQYFPMDGALMPAVMSWLTRAVTSGGTGINTSVEDQLWQRDRERILRDSAAGQGEAISNWAARGFPLPPGAANAAVGQVQRAASAKIREQSRDRAIKTFEQEIENVRFAITQAMDYRVKAVAAAGDYIRALALAPQIASQLATSSASAQANLINAASSYYGARIRVADLKFSAEKMNAEMTLRAGERNLDGFNRRLDVQASTAVAVAQSLGSQASSALNAVNGTSQIIQTLSD